MSVFTANGDARTLLRSLVCTTVVATVAHPCGAAAIEGGVGVDYASGPGDQQIQDALGYLTARRGDSDATVIGARYDNSVMGTGTFASVGAGISILGATVFRASGGRTIDDQGYRAWRVQAGPEFNVGGGRTLSVSYLHMEGNQAELLNRVVTEFGFPISPLLVGSLGASFAPRVGGRADAQGVASVTWAPVERVQVLGEVTVGQNVVGFSRSGPPSEGGVLGRLPVIGDVSSNGQDGAVKAEYGAQTAGLVGIRFLFP